MDIVQQTFVLQIFDNKSLAKSRNAGHTIRANKSIIMKPHRIAVAGTGYVGLSLATLLAQHNHVTAVDVIPEKVITMSMFGNE